MRANHCRAGRAQVLAALTAVGLCAAGIGCAKKGDAAAAANNKPAATNGAAVEDLYRVSADTTALYHYGPQQPNGPDLSLKKDTRVIMLKRGFGYSQVKVVTDNTVGYVGTTDLTPLSAEELAAERASQAAAAAQKGKRSPAIVGEYNIPPQAGSSERLPEPAAQPTPNPAFFRY